MERSVSVPNVSNFRDNDPLRGSPYALDPQERGETGKLADGFLDEELQKFFVNAVNLLRFDTVNSFDATLEKICLEDKLQPLVPYFLQWAIGKMTLNLKDGKQMFAVLELMCAIAVNANVNCGLYAHAFLRIAFTGLLSIELSDDGNDIKIRESAAKLLKIVCRRCESDFLSIRKVAFNHLVEGLFNPHSSMPAHYGVLAGIEALGCTQVLVPHLTSYVNFIRTEINCKENGKSEQTERVLDYLKELMNRYKQGNEGCVRVIQEIDRVYYE